MDSSSTKDIWYYWLQLWPSLVVALGIWAGGMTADSVAKVLVPASKDVVDGKVPPEMATTLPITFRLWWATRWLHPMLVGGACAFIPNLPRPEWVGSATSAVIWYSLVGFGNGQVHLMAAGLGRQATRLLDLIVPWVRQRLGLPARASTPAPAAPATDPMPSSDGTQLQKDDKP